MTKVVVLCNNYEPNHFPTEPDEEDRFFTYGFGSTFGKLISTYLRGYEVEVWRIDRYCKDKFYSKSVNGITYRVFKSTPIYKLGHYSKRFISEIKKENKVNSPVFLIVHTNSWQTYPILFSLKNAKIVTTHHGDWSPFYLYRNSNGLRKIKALMGILAEKLVLKNVDHFLIGDTRQVDYIKKAAPEMKYTIFSTGLDISKFKNISKEEARTELGLEQNKKYILYVGKLYKYKQVDRLIEIWKEIKNSRPELELLIVGNESKDKWGEEYYDLALKSGAKIIGRVLNVDLYKYYSAADVYVLMALRKDYFGGTGIAPLESLACNTPVVSYSLNNYLGDNVGEIGEVPETEEGYRKSIEKVLDEPGKYKNMKESIKKFYSLEVSAGRLDKVIKSL